MYSVAITATTVCTDINLIGGLDIFFCPFVSTTVGYSQQQMLRCLLRFPHSPNQDSCLHHKHHMEAPWALSDQENHGSILWVSTRLKSQRSQKPGYCINRLLKDMIVMGSGHKTGLKR